MGIVATKEAEYVVLGRLGFGSCNHLGHSENMFRILQEAHVDQLLLLGDNIYADTRNWLDMNVEASPQQIEHQYQKLFANKGKLVVVVIKMHLRACAFACVCMYVCMYACMYVKAKPL